MAQFYYCYGAMNSGKSLELLKVAHNYHEQGKHVLMMTSALDDRYQRGVIASRIGIHAPAFPIRQNTANLPGLIADWAHRHHLHSPRSSHGQQSNQLACLLIDEAQFLTRRQVMELALLVDRWQVPVMAYGLKTDFQNHLFPGSAALLEFADKIKEIKTICWFCGHKATMNLRISNHRPVYRGSQIQIGGNDTYLSVCRYHYYHPDLKLLSHLAS